MMVASWPLRSSVRITFAPALPPPAIRTYMSAPAGSAGGRRRVLPVGALDGCLLALGNRARSHRVAERVDRGRRRADRAQPARVVELGARRVEDPDDRAVDAESLLGDLADDQVRVVAIGGDDDRVGVFDAGLAQDGRVHAVADDEPAGPVLSEAVEGRLLLVDRSHVPAFGCEPLRDRRAHPAAADNDELHVLSVALGSTAAASIEVAEPPRSPGSHRRTVCAVPLEDALRKGDDEHL